MIRKIVFLIVLFSQVTASVAFCETSSFKVSATIPRIVGVNYFPEASEDGFNTATKSKKDSTEQIVLRDGQEVILKTNVAK